MSTSTTAPTTAPTNDASAAPASAKRRRLVIALIGKYQADGIAEPLAEIAAIVSGAGHMPVFEHDTAMAFGAPGAAPHPSMTLTGIGERADAAIVIGGDGTVLGIARQLAPHNVPLIGINQGRLGFMTDIALGDKARVLGEMLAGHYEIEERSMLQARVIRDGQEIFRALALNDVVVSRGAISGMVELSVDVDGRFMYTQRSDGLIVATPTGSTAYALSADGPILHPRLTGILLVPIAPHSLSNRPIVLPDTCRIEISVIGGREVSVNFDMQSFTALLHGDRVAIERAPMSIRFLHPVGYSYFATLRQKLHWNEHPVGADGRPFHTH